ncbi:MAG: polymer-forming cytoskeletal protein [Pseudomonadota bacterium]
MIDSPRRRLRDLARTSTTLIADGARIEGVISGESDVIVNGSVDGNCDITGTLTLAEQGSWAGTVSATNVIIAGEIDGDVIARHKVEVSTTAKINGTVTAEAIAVAEGAVVEGDMTTTSKGKPTSFSEKRQS